MDNNLPPQYPQTPQYFPKKSKKWIWWLVVILILMIGGGVFYYFYFYKPGNQSGLVNKNEIGCQNSNLFVTSAIGGKAPVDRQGNYQTTFATNGAQLVTVMSDKDAICATAISLPKNQNKVSFNAKSTAQAMIFLTIGILSTEPTEAQQRLDMIEQLNSFPALYSYVKTNLPKSDLGTLNKDSNLQTLLTNCVTEMGQKLNIIK